jgi:ribosomal protein S6
MAKEPKEEILETEVDHAEARVYELGFHIDAELSHEDVKKAYQSLKDLIAKNNGTLIAEGEPEKIQLAYTISRMATTGRRDFSTSYFGWIVYEIDGANHAAVIEAVNADLRIIRSLDLRTTKEAAKHSAEMHEFYRKAPPAPEAVEEDAAEVELDAALKEVGVV